MSTPEIRSNGVWTSKRIQKRIRELGDWFHNIDLKGVKTAPDHFLGDYPSNKWNTFAHSIPSDLTGKSVLDIGCNGGFYSLEMKRSGAARVLGIDSDDVYLNQARFAAEINEMNVDFRNMSVYKLPQLGQRFDIVMFMGVLYHLRHPLLALDLLHDFVVGDVLIFQSMQRGSQAVPQLRDDYLFAETEIFDKDGFPKMSFIENSYSVIGRTGGFRTARVLRECCEAQALTSWNIRSRKCTFAAGASNDPWSLPEPALTISSTSARHRRCSRRCTIG